MGLKIYKRSQGKYTRLSSAFGAALVVALGCMQLYEKLHATDLGLWVQTMVPAILFVILAILIFWLVNRPSVADFMVAAEGEMKKVSWSGRKEVAVSTFVVIMVVIVIAALLGITDWTFQIIFDWLLS